MPRSSRPGIAKSRATVAPDAITMASWAARTSAAEIVPGLVVARVVEFQGRLLVPTAAREGRLLALDVGAPGNPPAARLDSPLRTAPLVRGDTAFVLAQDGRVVGFRLRSVAGSER